MSAVGTAAGIVGGLIILGVAMNGGPAYNPDGSIDLGETTSQGARTGFGTAGDVATSAGEGVANGTVDAALDSDLVKAGLVIGGGYAVGRAIVTVAPKFRPSGTADEPEAGGAWCEETTPSGGTRPCADTVDDDDVAEAELVDDFVMEDIPELDLGDLTLPGYVSR